MKKGILTGAATAALLGSASIAHAGAFYLQEQSVKAAGRAFSGEAADTGAESLWWNPAAIGGVQSNAYLGASAILPKGDVIDTGSTIRRPGTAAASPIGGAGTAKDPLNKGVVPSGAVGVRLNDQISVGLAVTAPFNFTTNYDANSFVRYTADKSHLRTIDIQPSVAVAATDWLRIGIAGNFQRVKATLSNALPNLSPALADGSQRLSGKGWDAGFSAGIQIHNDRATLGLSYKSAIDHDLKGTVTIAGLQGFLAGNNGTVSTLASFETPWQAIAGVRFKATDKLTLNAQAVRIGWKRFDAIRLAAPLSTALPQNYRNTWSVAGGLDYDLSERFTLRGGVQYDQTPTRNGFRDARVPDGDRWNFAAGTTYKVTPAISLDAAVNYLKVKEATIDRPYTAYAGTAAQTPIVTAGRLDNASVWVLGLGGRFAF